MKPFKFFQKPNKIQDNWMDNMDDYILADIVRQTNDEREMVRLTDMMRDFIDSIEEFNDNLGSGNVTNSEVDGNIE
jgi:hypothetical protein